jgi:ATP-dependent exoDNAse (exonuclease V) beta subunit
VSLSELQLQAAHRIGQDVCVVAGPGSGKTSVLIERFRWLVTERGISPERILAITFTEKAATEIKQRMIAAFADNPVVRERIERAWVSTIHSFCARLLRENAIAAGIDPQFTVLERSAGPLREAADDTLEAMYERDPERMRRFLHCLAVATERDGFVPDLASSLVAIYESVRSAAARIDEGLLRAPDIQGERARLHELLRRILSDRPAMKTARHRDAHAALADWAERVIALPEQATREHFDLLSQAKYDLRPIVKSSAAHTERDAIEAAAKSLRNGLLIEYYAAERALVLEALRGLDELYRRRKREQSALDFDDLEEQAISLLENDIAFRMRVKSEFDFILMDELQDTNPLQWKLMDLVRRAGNFFAVGDVNQSIFGFRYADPELFHRYRQRLEAQGMAVDELRENWRSRAEVLTGVNAVFAGEAGIEQHSLLSARAFIPKPHPSIETITTPAESNEEGERIEALWVAHRIAELAGKLQLAEGPARYRDFAILTRANSSTAALQNALDEFGLPSLVLGGLTFFETREVQDLLLLLQVLVNPQNEVALAGLLRSPIFGLSDEDLLRMTLSGSLSETVRRQPPPYWNTIVQLREIRNQVSPDRLLRRVLDDCDYESGLSDRGRANVEKLLATLRTRYAANPSPLAVMLEEIEAAPPEAEAPPSDFGDAVRLMTIHKSKGLEFPIVFLPFLHRGRPGDTPIVRYSAEHGLGLRWRDPATGDPAPDTTWKLNEEAANRAQTDEENRLLYVAMTRAKEHLVLSWSDTPRSRGRWPALVQSKLAGVPLNVSVQDRAPAEALSERAAAMLPHDSYLPVIADHNQGDSSASVTDISRFVECPRHYYLSRYLRWDQPPRGIREIEDEEHPRPELDASELGREVHKILAHEPVESPTREAIELADRFFTSKLGRQAAKAVLKGHEWDFLLAIDELVLRGQVDLWFESNRELILLDYKTDRVTAPVARDSIAGYELQLQIYAMAIERALGRRPDRAILYFLRPNEAVEVDLHPLSLGAAQEAVYQFKLAQSQLHFPLREGTHCFRCDFFKGLCPAGRAERAGASERSTATAMLHVLEDHGQHRYEKN